MKGKAHVMKSPEKIKIEKSEDGKNGLEADDTPGIEHKKSPQDNVFSSIFIL